VIQLATPQVRLELAPHERRQAPFLIVRLAVRDERGKKIGLGRRSALAAWPGNSATRR